MTIDVQSFYRAALDADDAYSTELIRIYGQRGAEDARYIRNHPDAGVRAAAVAKLTADQAWRDARDAA